MSTKVKLKKSSVVGRVPSAGDLDYGEIAINYADGRIYYKTNNNEINYFQDVNNLGSTGLDSADVLSLIDSDYIQSLQNFQYSNLIGVPTAFTPDGVDSAATISLIDSDYIASRASLTFAGKASVTNYKFTADSGQSAFTGTDDNGLALSYNNQLVQVYLNGILLLDSDDYTKSNNDTITLSPPAASGDQIIISDYKSFFASSGFDSAGVESLIDSAYIQARQTQTGSSVDSSTITNIVDSAYINNITGIGSGDIDFGSNKITYSNVYSTEEDLPSASNYHGMFAHVHSTGAGYFAHAGNWVKLANQSEIFDGAYSSLTGIPNVLDSGNVTTLVDSAIDALIDGAPTALDTLNELAIQLNNDSNAIAAITTTLDLKLNTADAFDGNYSSLTGVPTEFAPTGVDSAATFNIIDSAYVAARAPIGYTDADVATLVDSAYVQARQAPQDFSYSSLTGVPTQFAPTGVDSNATFNIIDSAYVSSRVDIQGDIGEADISAFEFTADSGQTIFTGLDTNSATLSLDPSGTQVYLNGILLSHSLDYSVTSDTVTLSESASAGDLISVQSFKRYFNFVGLDSADVVSIISENDQQRDSSFVTNIVDVTYINSLTIDADTLGGQAGSHYLDYNNFVNVPTIPTNNNELTNGAGYITDYSVTESDVTTHQSALSITESQISDFGVYLTSADLTSYRTVTQIESMIDSNVNAVIDAAPDALNTLNELAAALGDDANFATTVTNQIAEKIDSANAVQIINSYGFTTYDSSNALSLIDSAYVQARSPAGYADGDVINLVDSAYINLRVDASIDSAGIQSIIDSAYINSKVDASLDSAGIESIIDSVIDSDYIGARTAATTITSYYFTADSDQTVITGQDDLSNTLSYTNGLQVYLNGILLTDSADYTQTNSSTVTLLEPANANDAITITAFTTRKVGVLDSAGVVSLIDSAYVQTRQTPQDFSYSSLTGVPTQFAPDGVDSAATFNIIDSAYVQARQTPQDFSYSSLTGVPTEFSPTGVDSNATFNIIDSAYINNRVEVGVDSASVLDIATSPRIYTPSTTYNVTVNSKTAGNKYYNIGSGSAYFIDGTETPYIQLTPGQTYVFDQSDASNSGHPLRFYYDADKTSEYSAGVNVAGTAGSAGSSTTIVVDDTTPSRLYYMCQFHGNMGWAIGIDTHNTTGLNTDGLDEGSTNQYFTASRAQAAFSGGTGVSVSSGQISIGQPVGTSDNVQFANLTVNGDFSVSGTTTFINTETLTIDDNIIVLNNNVTGAPSENAGIEVERGTSPNVSLIFNEDSDKWKVTTDGTNYYNILTSADSISAINSISLDGQVGSYYLDYNNFTNTPTSITDFNISDGNAGQVLTTDGSGNFTFTTISGGGGGGGVEGTTGVTQFKSTGSGSALFTTSAGVFSDVQVFVNGILQRDSDDYSFNDSSGNITFVSAPETDAEITVYGYKTSLLNTDSSDNLIISGDVRVGNHSKISSGTQTLSANSEGTIDTFDGSSIRGAKYVITVENDSDRYQISEALVIHDGSTATITTYGTINTGAGNLAIFDAEYDAGNVNIKATPTTINTTYKISRTDIVI